MATPAQEPVLDFATDDAGDVVHLIPLNSDGLGQPKRFSIRDEASAVLFEVDADAGTVKANGDLLQARSAALAAIAAIEPATGSIIFYSGTNWVELPKGADGEVLTMVGGVPAWAALP